MTATKTGLPRYDDAVAGFRIEDEIARLRADPATGINAYVECCGRHTGGNRWRCALSRPAASSANSASTISPTCPAVSALC